MHIGFNNPELFRVLLNNRGSRPQAAVVSITRAFEFPPLNGSVNPADGQLYLAGFQVLGWGTTSTRLAGLGRVRYTGAKSTLASAVVPMDKGLLLRFESPLDPQKATDPRNYIVTTWHYVRTYKYGSPQLKADDTPGVDRAGAEQRVSLEGRAQRIRGPAGHQARDADARRLDARHRRRHGLPGQRLVHALRADDVRSGGGRLREADRRSHAEDRRRPARQAP